MRCAKTREQDCSQRADHGQRFKPVRGKRNYRWQWRRGSPVSIPNTEVKPFSADGTWRVTARKSRSPPVPKWMMEVKASIIRYSSVAQWQSTRLLTGLLQVRVPPGEPRRSKVRSIQNRGFLAGFLGFSYRSLAPPFHEKSAIFHGRVRGIFAFRSRGVLVLAPAEDVLAAGHHLDGAGAWAEGNPADVAPVWQVMDLIPKQSNILDSP